MGFNCGIVGLPNVGKSTLFNALTQSQAAEAANFPFTTIEPNIGRVSVPDVRLDALADIAKPEKVVPTRLEFVDIAGLVKGASKGEGLGNKFLGNIREVDAIIHVLRCFDADTAADPINDADVVATELMLADMESLQKRTDNLIKKSRGQDKAATAELALVERTLKLLEDGEPARKLDVDPEEAKTFRMLSLLTAKPVLYVLNVDEDHAATGNAYSDKAAAMAEGENAGSVIISAKIEEEVAQLSDPAERQEFLESLDLTETGLPGRKKSAPGRLRRAPRRRRRRASSTPISPRASSPRKRSLMKTISRSAASSRPRKPEKCAPKAATTSSRTAM